MGSEMCIRDSHRTVCRTAHKCSDVRSYRAHRTTVPPGLWPGAPSGSSVPPLSARSDHHTRKVSRAGGCHRTGGTPLGVLISLQEVQTFKLDVVPTVPVVVRRQALVGWYNIQWRFEKENHKSSFLCFFHVPYLSMSIAQQAVVLLQVVNLGMKNF